MKRLLIAIGVHLAAIAAAATFQLAVAMVCGVLVSTFGAAA